MLCFVIPTFAFEWLSFLYHFTWIFLISDVLFLAFFAFITVVLLRYIFRRQKINADIVYGTICVYLLLGLIFAEIYTIIEGIYPNSITNFQPMNEYSLYEIVRYRMQNSIYYSFITLTTLGYGDMVPISKPAQYLSFMEAIIGLLFIGIVISRIVGGYLHEEIQKKINPPS